MSRHFDVVVIGAGPAGVAAGVYAGAEGLSALVLEDLAIDRLQASDGDLETVFESLLKHHRGEVL